MEFDRLALGRWLEDGPQHIDREQIRRFAEVTMDTHPWHLSGRVAPLVFAILPTVDVTNRAIADLVGNERPEDYPGFHGEHWIESSSPLTPGMAVRVSAVVAGVQATRGGTTIIVETATRDRGGHLVNRQFLTSILPNVHQAFEFGVPSPMKAVRVEESREWQSLGPTFLPVDLPLRYAEVSGDHHPYHVDPHAARAAGLRGTILHGVCAMAVASNVIVQSACRDDPTRLGGLGVRFAKPTFCGQIVTTRISPFTPTKKGSTASFETTDSAEEIILKNGLVVLKG